MEGDVGTAQQDAEHQTAEATPDNQDGRGIPWLEGVVERGGHGVHCSRGGELSSGQ